MTARKHTAHVVIDLDDVRAAGGVEQALLAWSENSDTTTSGVVGSSFSTSGPGPGWTKNHDEDDYSRRAFAECALYYLDASDGRLREAESTDDEATDDNDVYADIGGGTYRVGDWSDESVVRVDVPEIEDALAHPELVAAMAQSVIDYHGPESDRAEWKKLIESIRAAAEAVEDIDIGSLSD